uniref:CPG4 domain-containing protein n=1 Tax=Elaeophora elaphi TaxID=1147741 RepID=A0A0R3S686_9BILA
MHRIVVLLSLITLSLTNTITSEVSYVENDIEEDDKMLADSNSTLPSTTNSTLETKYLMESELVRSLLHGAYMNGFSLFDFLENLKPSDCLQVCLDEVASMLEQPFAGQRYVDEVGNICSHFDIFQRCLHHNTSCKNALLDVTTTVIDYLCTFNQEAFGEIFPCLYGHSAVIYFTCDNQCKMGEVLSKASETKKDDVANILDGNENKLLEMPNLYNLCSASACFINCTHNLAEKECSIGRSTLLHKIVAAVVNHTITTVPNPEMKSSDAYTLLVSSILPNECQRLKLLSQEVTLATPMSDFIGNMEYGSNNSIVQQKVSLFQTAYPEGNDAIRTILHSHVENQTNSVYMQILPINGHQMKLQCQMIDLETGREATVANIATLMATEARNIFNEFGLRSVEDEQVLENNAKHDDESSLQDRKIIGSKSK